MGKRFSVDPLIFGTRSLGPEPPKKKGGRPVLLPPFLLYSYHCSCGFHSFYIHF